MMIHDSALGRFYNAESPFFGPRMYRTMSIGAQPRAIVRARASKGLGEVKNMSPECQQELVEELRSRRPSALGWVIAGASGVFGAMAHLKLYRAMSRGHYDKHGGYKLLYFGGAIGSAFTSFFWSPAPFITNGVVWLVANSMEKSK